MKYIWALFGFIFLGIGALGVVLPGLPGTPFLLIALFCFTRSSERLHQWFIQTQIYQNHLKEFKEKGALSKKAKYWILAVATIGLTIGFYFTPSAVGRSIIVVILAIKYWVFLFKIKNLDELA